MNFFENINKKKIALLSIAGIIIMFLSVIILFTLFGYADKIFFAISTILGTLLAIAIPAILIIGGLGIYLLPIFTAIRRKHSNLAPIVLLTIFLGWIGIGWVIALIWAFTDNTK